jgi:tyrosyl-tRNA synthetase
MPRDLKMKLAKTIVTMYHDEKSAAQAEKNFEIKRQIVTAQPVQEIPKQALVTTGSEVNVYRYRTTRYKRIDFEVIRKTENKVFIKSKELEVGDEIVIHGTGLLRIAEIAAFGGAPEGHSH